MDFQEQVHPDAAPKPGTPPWIGRRLLRQVRRHAVACGIFAALSSGLAAPFARAADIPIDPHGFTAYVAAQFQKALPAAKIAASGDLKLLMTSSGRNFSVSLENVYGACRRDQPSCGESIKTFVTNATALLTAPPPSLDRASLRVVVRPSNYVDSLRNRAGFEPVATPVEGDFWMVVASDLPTSIQPLGKKALEALHLSPDEAFAVAKTNMSASMRDEIHQVLQKPLDGIGLIAGDDYMSSLFAFPDMWTPLAQALGGNLLVAVPSTDMIVFEDARTPQAAEQVAGTAHIVMNRANRRFSADVFRWTPDGWKPVSAGGANHP